MIKIACISDWHTNSKNCDYDSIRKSAKEINKSCDLAFHCGDLTDGLRVYSGQEQEIESNSIDEIIEKAGNLMSEFSIPVYWITGNHDDALWRKFGVDISNYLDIPNWTYLGKYVGDNIVDSSIWFRLLHPSGKAPYSLSYVPQKYIRNINLKKDPIDWLLLGHFHQGYLFETQGVKCLGIPSFQKITDYAKRKGYGEEIGYWILELMKDGSFKAKERLF